MRRKIKIINGSVITTHRILEHANILVSDNKITKISQDNLNEDADTVIDAEGYYVSPGFIDIHVHGGGGSDFMDGTVKDFLTVGETHARYGTTTMIPTTLTADKNQLINTLEVYREANKKNQYGSQFMGMHLEGPYFAMNQRGAQDPRYIRKPNFEEYSEIIRREGDIIARWSAAPEIDGALEFGRYLVEHNILPAMAHTDAVYEDVVGAFENGYTLATHFYSGMSGVSRKKAFRYAGVIESVYLIDEIDTEIIADGVHLPAPFLKLIYKVKGVDRIALVTDAMRAAGTNVKESVLGSRTNGLKVLIEDGVAKLPDRSSFAGSVATADRLLRTMTGIGEVPLVEAVRMLSLTPARIMKLDKQKGSLSVGKDADIVIFDKDIKIHTVIIAGNIVSKS
ncbi:MAG: N-acetylglucosamine-6-phosphate deacetylase [Chitinophagaceae bacterium]|nr:N-acetylglucosamine-6-phosphate deacetylase [Chitinophagaceae bacterium]MCZ2339167.1 N-acetylglucosamine-6-phosphate deacetylase [Chitinophagales bacterium]